MIRFDYDSLGCSLLVIGLVMQYEYSVASDRENEEAVCVFHFFTSFILLNRATPQTIMQHKGPIS